MRKFALAFCATLAMSSVAAAIEYPTADELRSAVAGSQFSRIPSAFNDFTQTWNQDGTAKLEIKPRFGMGETVTGTWEVKDGQLCTTLNSTSRGSGRPETKCSRYEKVGDKLFALNENGTHISDRPMFTLKQNQKSAAQ